MDYEKITYGFVTLKMEQATTYENVKTCINTLNKTPYQFNEPFL